MTTRSIWRPDKDEVVAEHGAVATAHPIAAQVILEELGLTGRGKRGVQRGEPLCRESESLP